MTRHPIRHHLLGGNGPDPQESTPDNTEQTDLPEQPDALELPEQPHALERPESLERPGSLERPDSLEQHRTELNWLFESNRRLMAMVESLVEHVEKEGSHEGREGAATDGGTNHPTPKVDELALRMREMESTLKQLLECFVSLITLVAKRGIRKGHK